jgi:hypothetical protein
MSAVTTKGTKFGDNFSPSLVSYVPAAAGQ